MRLPIGSNPKRAKERLKILVRYRDSSRIRVSFRGTPLDQPQLVWKRKCHFSQHGSLCGGSDVMRTDYDYGSSPSFTPRTKSRFALHKHLRGEQANPRLNSEGREEPATRDRRGEDSLGSGVDQPHISTCSTLPRSLLYNRWQQGVFNLKQLPASTSHVSRVTLRFIPINGFQPQMILNFGF